MRRYLKTTCFMIALMSVVVACAWAGPAASPDNSRASGLKGPMAVFSYPTYEFEPLFEGEDITHDFVVENKGDAPLVIKNVKPG